MSDKIVVGRRFEFVREIGKGSFGQVHIVRDLRAGGRLRAAKVEWRKDTKGFSQLKYENDMYDYLRARPEVGMPRVHYFKRHKKFSMLVLDLLGKNLQQIFEKQCEESGEKRISLKVTAILTYKMLERLQYLHDRGVVHRDLKPQNIVFGREEEKDGDLYIIDFGLSKRFRLRGEHVTQEKRKGIVGTLRYISVACHDSLTQSARDDCESLMYVMAFVRRGSLPWQGLKDKDRERRYERVKLRKLRTRHALFRNPELQSILDDICKLKFDERPKYDEYKRRLLNVLQQERRLNTSDASSSATSDAL